jgi:hypothetical protein
VSVAQWKAELMARRPKPVKLVESPALKEYVQKRLSGEVQRADGTVAPGPTTLPCNGRNKPRRQDRRWALARSPEQISNRLPIDFPDDDSMRISHEAIYQTLYVQGRGALTRDLVACLRTGRALRDRHPRRTQHQDTMLVHLPRMEGYGIIAPTKNGPPLGGYGAVAMKDALTATMSTLPEQLRRSLTWDRGKELAQNTNELLRQYFPKGTNLTRWAAEDVEAVAAALNARPRKTLGWKSSAEALDEHLRSLQEPGVATTG